MAKLTYEDTLTKDGIEGMKMYFDQERIIEAGQMLKASIAWFEQTTGRILIPSSSVEEPIMAPIEQENAVVDIKLVPKQRARRRSKAEMAEARTTRTLDDNEKLARVKAPAQAEMKAQEAELMPSSVNAAVEKTQEPPTDEASTSAPTVEDVRFAAEGWLEKRGPEGANIFMEMLINNGAFPKSDENPRGPRISDLDDAGLHSMMAILMQK